MARRKMTEEEKATSRMLKANAFNTISKSMKYLSFAELDEVVGLANRQKKELLGKEEVRLIKEKEKIELQLQKLKGIDASEN